MKDIQNTILRLKTGYGVCCTLSMLMVICLLTGCGSPETPAASLPVSEPGYWVEEIPIPIGNSMDAWGEYCMWTIVPGERLLIFQQREKKDGVEQFVVHSYDCLTHSWESSPFVWNEKLVESRINLQSNYMEDSLGNMYFIGAPAQGKNAVTKIYQISSSGQVAQMDSENKLIPADRNVTDFQLLEDGTFLVAVEEEISVDEWISEFSHIDFNKGEKMEMKCLEDVTSSGIILSTLTCMDNQIVYPFQAPYQVDGSKIYVKFQKIEETLPEKIVTFDYELNQGPEDHEWIEFWNLARNARDGVYVFLKKGIWDIEGEQARQVVKEEELQEIFTHYDDIIGTMQVEGGEYFVVVQKDTEVGFYRVHSENVAK
ncbi:MAG: hypothetical protein J1F02_06830 [Lachnospiraceae bacterium]|nr:hypothetical protein [Lachnospiraceae bacterium]